MCLEGGGGVYLGLIQKFWRGGYEKAYIVFLITRRVATCKPGKLRLTSFSETLALFFIQFLSFRKMKVYDRQMIPRAYQKKLAGYAPDNSKYYQTINKGGGAPKPLPKIHPCLLDVCMCVCVCVCVWCMCVCVSVRVFPSCVRLSDASTSIWYLQNVFIIFACQVASLCKIVKREASNNRPFKWHVSTTRYQKLDKTDQQYLLREIWKILKGIRLTRKTKICFMILC